jgi:hypothetical protein
MSDARDAARWRSMRRRLIAASIASGRHDSGAEHHCPIGEACTSAYWDRLADHAIAMDEAAGLALGAPRSYRPGDADNEGG